MNVQWTVRLDVRGDLTDFLFIYTRISKITVNSHESASKQHRIRNFQGKRREVKKLKSPKKKGFVIHPLRLVSGTCCP